MVADTQGVNSGSYASIFSPRNLAILEIAHDLSWISEFSRESVSEFTTTMPAGLNSAPEYQETGPCAASFLTHTRV